MEKRRREEKEKRTRKKKKRTFYPNHSLIHYGQAIMESRMMGNYHVRFGKGVVKFRYKHSKGRETVNVSENPACPDSSRIKKKKKTLLIYKIRDRYILSPGVTLL
jgi:hypothetical protein